MKHEDQATFLGILFVSNMSWKSQSSVVQTRLKQRTGLFAEITGSVKHPRANNEISLKILHAMIEPVMYYRVPKRTLETLENRDFDFKALKTSKFQCQP